MKRLPFSIFLAVVLVLIFSSITASAQQPRAVPPNDNIIGAKVIMLGKDYLVTDIGAATNEIGEPTATCSFAGLIPNSVWFSFSVPEFTRMYLSTVGTVLVSPADHDYYTVLAIFELTGGVMTERACSSYQSETPFAQMEFAANPGTTYYLAAGTRFDIPYLPESTLKINTRVLRTMFEPPNSGFEAPISPDDWKLKNADNDAVVCADPAYPALDDSCAFKFTGTPGLTTKLVNSVPFPTTFLPRKNALLGTVIFFRVMDTAAIGDVKFKAVVSYADGTPPSVQTANLNGRAAMGSYSGRVFWNVLKSKKVASVKVEIKFASPTGTLMVDTFNFIYQADVVTRSSGLLPVPPHAP